MFGDLSNMSAACQSGAQSQDYTTRKMMWDDIQQLKEDVLKLRDAINHIQEFMKKVYP